MCENESYNYVWTVLDYITVIWTSKPHKCKQCSQVLLVNYSTALRNDVCPNDQFQHIAAK